MKTDLTSVDRSTSLMCEVHEPDRYRDLLSLPPDRKWIPRGAGLSYVAASFAENSHSVRMTKFDRILAFNPDERWVDVEAGISLGKLYDFLGRRGFYLSVQPGYPQITIGGCIAGNVHGKNQYREGCFEQIVRTINLFHPSHGILSLSRDKKRGLFDLTCGGFGLTGIIISARLSIAPLPAKNIAFRCLPIADLNDAFREIAAAKTTADILYAWLDFSSANHAGQGFVVIGNFEPGQNSSLLPGELSYRPIDPSAPRIRIPILSSFLLGPINILYRATVPRSLSRQSIPVHHAIYPTLGKERYFDSFGSTGFIEKQTLLPAETIHEYAAAFTDSLRTHGRSIALTTIKAFGGSQSLLRYTGSGYSFTIDVPNTPQSRKFLAALDEIDCRFGGITSILKDSRLSANIVRRQYSQYNLFRDKLREFDPKRIFMSDLSQRIGL